MTMEDIAWNLKLSEVKQRSLGKAHETLRAQADSMIQFSVQWKELVDLFDSTRNSLQTELQELQELKKEIDCRLADFETKELNFNLVMGAKAKQLQGIVQEVEESKSQLQSLKLSIQEHCEKYEVEENRLGKVQKLVKGKKTEYFSIQQRIKEVSNEIESKSKEIECKERQLNAVQGKVVDQWKEFDLKDEEIRAKQTLIEEYDRELKSKEQKPGLIHKLVLEYSNAIESKIKDFNLLEKSVGVWDCKLELRELEIKRWFEKLEKQFESKFEELNLIDKRVKDCMNEVQLKEKHLYPRKKHLDSLDKSIQECARRLEQQAKELELKQQQFEKSTEEHTRKQKSKEKADTLHSQVKVEQLECILNNNAVVPSPTNNQSSIIRDGRSLQVFMNEYFRMTDRVSAEVSTGLHVSSDPAKLVLDAMQGFYTSNSTVGNREFGFDLSVIRRSCIHLLKELKRVSPEINDQVREEAKKLAGDWKAKMIVAAENWLEVLGYLWLLTAYDLASTYDVGELQTLRGIAAEHGLPAERCGILDMADKAPASGISCSTIKTEKPESSLDENAATFSSPNLQLSATTNARNLQGVPNEHLSRSHFTQNETLQIATDALPSALNGDGFVKLLGMISRDKQLLEYYRGFGFGDKITADVIANLIERKQLIEAVRCIYTFNLMDKFPLVPLLKEYVDDIQKHSWKKYVKRKSLDEMDKIADNQMVDLLDVIQCIKDYNLESEYPSRDIEVEITKLQKLKENYKRCHASKVEQQQKKGKKHSFDAFAPKFQPQHPKSNCKLTTVAAATPYALPTPTSGYPQSSSSSLPYENNGRPGQFGMGASYRDISKGNCFHCGELGHWSRNCQKYSSEKKKLDMTKSSA
ncbi:unnamed protein product [Prunus armeniaca]